MEEVIEKIREWQKSWDSWDGYNNQPKSVEEAVEPSIKAYANQRVIEELYEALCDNPVDMVSHLKNIIKELKAECK